MNTLHFYFLLLLCAGLSLASCPRKCHFNDLNLDLDPDASLTRIPCPPSCQLYSCLKTFGPNLPAFGIGVACAEPGLPTESPPAMPPPVDTIATCTDPVKELPFLSEILPEGPIPPCPTISQPCPEKCYFPIEPEPQVNFISCPSACVLYSCLKTFPPMLPAFGTGVACARPGLETIEPPGAVLTGEFNRRCDGELSSGQLPFLKDVLPEASVPPCPRS